MTRARRIVAALTSATALAAAITVGTGSAASANPVEPSPGFSKMGQSPAGANDWNCRPSATHPRPVVLVHGTFEDMASTWKTVAPALAQAGYCVFSLNYGGYPDILDPSKTYWGIGPIPQSGKELGTFVDSVLQHTGARQVDLVGHSQGGVVAREYMRFDGGTDPADPAKNDVHSLVTLGATNHGTSFGGIQQLAAVLRSLGLPGDLLIKGGWGVAGLQQLHGSRVLTKLNKDSDVQPGVHYTAIASRYDSVSTPPAATFFTGSAPGATVDNVWLQDGCPSDHATHMGLVTNPRALYLVRAALNPLFGQTHSAPCAPATPGK